MLSALIKRTYDKQTCRQTYAVRIGDMQREKFVRSINSKDEKWQ